MLEIIKKTKSCTKCKIEKSTDSFYKSKKEKDGLQTYCKDCKRDYSQKNKTYDKEYFINYRRNNIKKILLQKKEYREKHKDKISSYATLYVKNNKEYFSKKFREYYQTIKGKASVKNNKHKRRSLTKQGDVTTLQLAQLQQNTKCCYWCNKSLKNVNVHIDHYIPLSKGGKHTLSNLVVSCQSCNNRKHAKDPIVFANSIGKLL